MVNSKENKIILNINFIYIVYGTIFFVVIYTVAVSIMYFSGVFDFSQNICNILNQFLDETKKSSRFFTISLMGLVCCILAIISLIKTIKNPHLIILDNDKISHPKKNISIKIKDISEIYKSPYPVFGKRIENDLMFILLYIPLWLFLFITYLTTFIVKIFLGIKPIFYTNILINDKEQYRINIYIVKESDLKRVKDYFERHNIVIKNKKFKFYL